jgi:hypothetical protein
LPHAPQFVVDVANVTSQPSLSVPLQFAKPAEQVPPHAPPSHSLAPFATAEHAVEHVPQCAALTAPFTSQPSDARPLQSANVELHAYPHAPPEHVPVAFAGLAHTVPQAPQFDGDVAVETSQPFDATWSQSANPALHDATVHEAPLHAAVAFGRLHALWHAPQFAGSIATFVSQPFEGLPSQFM